jgi:chemotaxis signal transduction protein
MFDVGAGIRVAAGAHQVVEYLLAPETIPLPLMPAHCRGVLLWREQLIPVVDILPLLPAHGVVVTGGWRRAVVLAWQDAPGKPLKHGALVVRAAPVESLVADDMACALPPDAAVFGHIASSCFRHEDSPVPILDIVKLFGQPLSDTLLPREEKMYGDTDVAEPALMVPSVPSSFAIQAAPVVKVAVSGSIIPASETDPPPCVAELVGPLPVGEMDSVLTPDHAPEESSLPDNVEHIELASEDSRAPPADVRPSARAGQVRPKFNGSHARTQASGQRQVPARRYKWLFWTGCVVAAALLMALVLYGV